MLKGTNHSACLSLDELRYFIYDFGNFKQLCSCLKFTMFKGINNSWLRTLFKRNQAFNYDFWNFKQLRSSLKLIMLKCTNYSTSKQFVWKRSGILFKIFEILERSFTGKHYQITRNLISSWRPMATSVPGIFYFQLVSEILSKKKKIRVSWTLRNHFFIIFIQ